MNRRKIRDHIFKIIFSYDFEDQKPSDEPINNYFAGLETDEEEEDIAQISDKVKAILQRQEEIDSIITTNAVHWKGERIAKVEMAILRVAVYELKFDDDIPQNVALNEAVELGKKYGGDQSAGFLNGLLANIVRTL